MLFRSAAIPTKSKKTIIRSFRISEESFNVLEEEAALLNVSVNTLVDQIIGYILPMRGL
jgi:predicted HicB family RNase H-like nuclease